MDLILVGSLLLARSFYEEDAIWRILFSVAGVAMIGFGYLTR